MAVHVPHLPLSSVLTDSQQMAKGACQTDTHPK